MAKQFRLGETLRQRGAVDLDQRTGGARAVVVQPAGNAGFAGAGFALDQHRGKFCAEPFVRGDDLVELLTETGQRIAKKNLCAGCVGVAAFVLGEAGGLAAGLGTLQDHRQHIGVDGFLQVVLCAVADGLDCTLHPALRSAYDHGCIRGKDPVAKQVGAEPVGQVDVEQREVER